MISFYPGPSRVYDEIPQYVRDAAQAGIMSINHRSETFVAISKKTISLLKQKLGVPKNYTVLFISSATESWEIIAQSWITNRSYHFFNGSFGQKWFDYTKRLKPGATPLPFEIEKSLDPEPVHPDPESVICITQNETSNGTQVHMPLLAALRKNNPNHLIAVDATSSLAGIQLDIKLADIWFASVQKCFGLPAGMGLMICSPQAIDWAQKINERDHYNSVMFMTDMMKKWQTPYTPNVLSIYLLMRVLENRKPIRGVHAATVNRYKKWVTFLSERHSISHVIKNKAVHSYTVLPVTAQQGVDKIKSAARKNGFLLGEGYGELKSTTFRIANFPALRDSEIKKLMSFLKVY